MSVIAVRTSPIGIDIAVDSQTTYGDNKVQRGQSLGDSKLWATGAGLLIAFVGSSTLGAVMRRWTAQQTPAAATEAAIYDWLDAFHADRTERYRESGDIDEFGVVLAYRGTAWVIDGYAASRVPENGYMAHGSGMGPALGALFCGASAMQAVAAACAHAECCGGPVVCGHMTPDGRVSGTMERLPLPETAEQEQAA